MPYQTLIEKIVASASRRVPLQRSKEVGGQVVDSQRSAAVTL